MLSDNISKMRKERGLTQEALAVKLNVVRQTVSKWEKGISVPDAEMLVKIADALEVSAAELLGESSVKERQDYEAIAKTLAELNEQFAIRNRRSRRVWKVIGIILAAMVILAAAGTGFYRMAAGAGSAVVQNESYETQENGIPLFDRLEDMTDADLTEALLAVKREQLHEAWGEPDFTEEDAESWEIREGVCLKVRYDEKGYALSCGKE